MKKVCLLAMLGVFGLLSGCMFPEKIDMKVEFNPDASYAIHFNGQVASFIHLMGAHEAKRPISPKDDAEISAEAVKMSKPTPQGTQSAKYLGNARLQYVVDNKYKPHESLSFLGTLLVNSDKSGVVTVKAATLTPKNKADFSTLGLAMSGVFSVALPNNAKLISSNADATERTAGGTVYTWRVKSAELQPKLVFSVAK